ncbi:MAG: HAD hydrolase-like protein [Deferribacteres bacterium]|nr:HAD hydrolase-like protein [candidate division KSB1 bacterium]MCB9502520.1 HAD hydrolase-like protein [Deferribacteres bacterium]
MKALLFDIDGTLINSGGAGFRAMTRAFASVFNITDGLKNIMLSGMTDMLIFQDACKASSVDYDDRTFEQFMDTYLTFLGEEMPKENPEKMICPGVRALLIKLSTIPDVHLGLLTGNFAVGAKIKLEEFDLHHYFSYGAYGDDNWDRNLLYDYAIDRLYQKTGSIPRSENVWIIGDTPRDIACARPHGAISIAVATGIYKEEQLTVENPHYLFADLTDIERFMQIINK